MDWADKSSSEATEFFHSISSLGELYHIFLCDWNSVPAVVLSVRLEGYATHVLSLLQIISFHLHFIFNLLVTWCTTSLTFINCTFCPHCVCCNVRTATCATYSIIHSAFLTEMKSVYSEVRTGPLTKAVCALPIKGLYLRSILAKRDTILNNNEYSDLI
jgi:hypothetical protein